MTHVFRLKEPILRLIHIRGLLLISQKRFALGASCSPEVDLGEGFWGVMQPPVYKLFKNN